MLLIGSTDKNYLKEGIEDYRNRIIHYLPFELKVIPDIKNSKNLTEDQQKEREGKAILDLVATGDDLILLDAGGLEMTSPGMSAWLQKKMVAGTRHLVFVVGGPYGFSEAVVKRADAKLSLSKLTFPHQLVRLIFVEQLYRALTIMRGEPYHHV
ncbi:MAG: 23S rRNA (pseudouridine(1915)-N(3))-methyltransferase RlmH [Marinilabiliales bacterium]|nr:23S rRNA (pseudouridine(1915)-N(3))-methyltransferase RlmH [Marinilabiliales bacterium]